MAHTITITEPKDPPKDLPNPFNVKVEIGWDPAMLTTKLDPPFELKYTVIEPQMVGNTVTYVAVYNDTQVVVYKTQPLTQNVAPVGACTNATILVTLIEVEPLPMPMPPNITVHDTDLTAAYSFPAGPTVPQPPM